MKHWTDVKPKAPRETSMPDIHLGFQYVRTGSLKKHYSCFLIVQNKEVCSQILVHRRYFITRPCIAHGRIKFNRQHNPQPHKWASRMKGIWWWNELSWFGVSIQPSQNELANHLSRSRCSRARSFLEISPNLRLELDDRPVGSNQ